MIHTRPRRSIPRSSPFAVLRDLPLVDPQLVNLEEDEDWNLALEAEELIHRLFPQVEFPADHPAARYLGYSQNDGTVLGFFTTPTTATLRFSHHDISRLASTYLRDWNEVHDGFPADLIFEDVAELIVLRQIEQGVFQRPRHPVCASDIGRIVPLHVAPGEMRFFLDLRGKRWHGFSRTKSAPASWYLDDYYIFIRCRDVRIEEDFRGHWTRRFQGEHLDVFDRFQSVWPVPRWGMVDFDHWIETGEAPEAT